MKINIDFLNIKYRIKKVKMINIYPSLTKHFSEIFEQLPLRETDFPGENWMNNTINAAVAAQAVEGMLPSCLIWDICMQYSRPGDFLLNEYGMYRRDLFDLINSSHKVMLCPFSSKLIYFPAFEEYTINLDLNPNMNEIEKIITDIVLLNEKYGKYDTIAFVDLFFYSHENDNQTTDRFFSQLEQSINLNSKLFNISPVKVFITW